MKSITRNTRRRLRFQPSTVYGPSLSPSFQLSSSLSGKHQHHHHHPHQRVSCFSDWAPWAYRPQTIHKTNDDNDGGSDDDDHDGDGDREFLQDRIYSNETVLKKIKSLQKELLQAVELYQNELSIHESTNTTTATKARTTTRTQDVTTEQMISSMQQLSHLLITNKSTPTLNNETSMEMLLASEVHFKTICRILQKLILRYVQVTKDSRISEQLLFCLIDLRAQRAQTVENLTGSSSSSSSNANIQPSSFKPTSANTDTNHSILGWIQSIFVANTTASDDNNNTMDDGLIAHFHCDYGPHKSHFKDVINHIFHDVPQNLQLRGNTTAAATTTIMERRADRLTRLLRMMPTHGIIPPSFTVRTVLQALAAVGSVQRAQEAEELMKEFYSEQEHDEAAGGTVPVITASSHMCSAVLMAYRTAASAERSPKKRAMAAECAEDFVRQLHQQRQAHVEQIDRSYLYSLALQSVLFAGKRAVPDAQERANQLAVECLGNEVVNAIFQSGEEQQPQQTKPYATGLSAEGILHVLHCLTLVYCRRDGDPDDVQKAKQIISFMETLIGDLQPQQQPQQRNRKPVAKQRGTGRRQRSRKQIRSSIKEQAITDNDADSELATISFRFHETYDTVLRTISGNSSLSNKNADFAHDLLHRILQLAETQQLAFAAPSMKTYLSVLAIWAGSKANNAGPKSQQVLEWMQLQSLYDPTVVVNPTAYQRVMQCWQHSARSYHPDASHQANRLLRFMEARSEPVSSSFERGHSGEEDGDKDHAGRKRGGGSRGVKQDDADADTDDHEDIEQESSLFTDSINLRPKIITYNSVLQVCLSTRLKKNKDEASHIFQDVYRRLQARQDITPNHQTYLNLLWCCSNLFPTDSDIPKTLAATYMEDFWKMMKMTNNRKEPLPALREALKAIDHDLYEENFGNDSGDVETVTIQKNPEKETKKGAA